MQIVIDANTRLTVAVGHPTPGNRNHCRAYRDSGVDRQCHGATVMADGGYQGNPEVINPIAPQLVSVCCSSGWCHLPGVRLPKPRPEVN